MTHAFLTVLEAGKPDIRMPADAFVGESRLPGLPTATSSLHPYVGERGSSGGFPPLMKTLIPSRGALPSCSNPNYPPWPHLLLRLGCSLGILGGHKHSIPNAGLALAVHAVFGVACVLGLLPFPQLESGDLSPPLP